MEEINLKEFTEVPKEQYARFPGERVCYWDKDHNQHFYIKRVFPLVFVLNDFKVTITNDLSIIISEEGRQSIFLGRFNSGRSEQIKQAFKMAEEIVLQ